MSTALSHLPPDWPTPGPTSTGAVFEALSVADSLSDAEMLELAWEWARLDGQFGEVVEEILKADEGVL